ncbi:MAG TPA: serine/threonine-protein kinase [Thermoanaerobaculia bacterium]|nr:serine/threonine-protein kinase [Thermoanaerobaculia bacterium]
MTARVSTIDSDKTVPSDASGATSGGQSSESGTTLRVEAARVRGSEPSAAFAPTGPSAERGFFAERLALFGRIAFLASSGFLLMRVVLNAVAERGAHGAPLEKFPVFHLVATACLLAIWLLAGSRSFSNRRLRTLDAVGTIAAALAYAAMAWTMPLSWRPDQLVLLIMNAVLLGRAALVPCEPRRTAWISAASVVAIPFVTYRIFRANPSADLVAGAVVTQAILWATFVVVLATVISSITFHLRRSIARARRLGQYQLLEKIGEGGMGVVYRAEHEMLRRPTAIKLLAPGNAGENNLRRFEREAQLTARLTSPHTVSVYDFGRTPEGAFYYVMEYLDGIDLERLVREGGPLPPGRVVHVLLQVCEALAEAHGVGLVHRDIKPANILLSDVGGIPDFAKVLDFGLVKDVTRADDVRLTREDVFAGTPQYLAPETIENGMSSDPRSDIYALGGVAYYLLTGTPVFDGRLVEVIQSHLQRAPEPPSARLGRRLPEKLERVVLDCLEKDPVRRPESARALSDRLAACDDVEPWLPGEARKWWSERKSPDGVKRAGQPGS